MFCPTTMAESVLWTRRSEIDESFCVTAPVLPVTIRLFVKLIVPTIHDPFPERPASTCIIRTCVPLSGTGLTGTVFGPGQTGLVPLVGPETCCRPNVEATTMTRGGVYNLPLNGFFRLPDETHCLRHSPCCYQETNLKRIDLVLKTTMLLSRIIIIITVVVQH